MVDNSDLNLTSNLPQRVIESILIELPTKDVIKNMHVIEKWRYRWSSIIELVIEENIILIHNIQADGPMSNPYYI